MLINYLIVRISYDGFGLDVFLDKIKYSKTIENTYTVLKYLREKA